MNPRPPAPKAGALPLRHSPVACRVGRGFAKTRSVGQCANAVKLRAMLIATMTTRPIDARCGARSSPPRTRRAGAGRDRAGPTGHRRARDGYGRSPSRAPWTPSSTPARRPWPPPHVRLRSARGTSRRRRRGRRAATPGARAARRARAFIPVGVRAVGLVAGFVAGSCRAHPRQVTGALSDRNRRGAASTRRSLACSSMSTMRAVVCKELGPPEALVVEERGFQSRGRAKCGSRCAPRDSTTSTA